jgi:hypothetical protein
MSTASVRPSRAWYWVAGVILTGAAVLLALAAVGIVSMVRTVDGFQRVRAPGHGEVMFAEPGGYTAYFEGPGIADASDTGRVDVTLERTSAGPPPVLGDYHGKLTYNIAGHEGLAVGTIQIDERGTYLLTVGKPSRPGVTDIAVGRSVGRGIGASVLMLVTAILVLVPAGLVVGILTVVRRRRDRRAQPTAPPGGFPAVADAAGGAGWHADPARRHEYRFWDGAGWTEHVTDQGAHAVDPLDELSISTAVPGGAPAGGSGRAAEDVD